jgi:hypothetical protein
MHRLLLLPVAMCLTFQTNAACRQDTVEVGDTGPDDAIVCAFLESLDAGTDAWIVNRYILTADRVSLAIVRGGKPLRLEYQLSGVQWQLKDNNLLAGQ